jgi:hypothetical protein
MSNLRFFTAREVFEAFPGAAGDMAATPQDDAEAPLDFLARLVASPTPEDAISFCAYMLGRREAVWWACACHRLLGLPSDREDEKALLTAEAWVREPEEHRRRAALALGLSGNHDFAGTWLALAAGGSGGTFIINGQAGPPIPADMAAKAVRSAVLISLARLPIRERAARLPACVDICRRLAQGQAETS